MMNLPMTFNSHSHASASLFKPWVSYASGFEIQSDIPKEFSGNGQGFSPEDLYSLALQNCFIATFKVIADKSKLEYSEIEIDLNLILDKNEDQLTVMKEAYFKVKLKGTINLDKAHRILEKTSKSAMVLNSVKTNFFFEFQVEV